MWVSPKHALNTPVNFTTGRKNTHGSSLLLFSIQNNLFKLMKPMESILHYRAKVKYLCSTPIVLFDFFITQGISNSWTFDSHSVHFTFLDCRVTYIEFVGKEIHFSHLSNSFIILFQNGIKIQSADGYKNEKSENDCMCYVLKLY